MRPAPGPIPKLMPTFDDAIRNIVMLMDMPRASLADRSISDLVTQLGGGGPKWLTGSTVWLPAVFGQVDRNTDLDVVFGSKDECQFFITNVTRELPGGFTVTSNRHGAGRILHPDGHHVIDAWALEDDESIQELLLTYPHEYQRCAYFMTWSGASPGYLTRIVKPRQRLAPMEATRAGGYRRGPAAQAPAHAPGFIAPMPTVTLDIDAVVGRIMAAPQVGGGGGYGR